MDTPTPAAVPAAIRAARERRDERARLERLIGAAAVRGRDWAHGEARRRQAAGQTVEGEWPYTVSNARLRVLDMAIIDAEVQVFAEAVYAAAIERWERLRRK